MRPRYTPDSHNFITRKTHITQKEKTLKAILRDKHKLTEIDRFHNYSNRKYRSS